MASPSASSPSFDALSVRHRAFLRAYTLSRDAKAAAIEAGYAEASAAVTGFRILERDDIKAALAEHEAALNDQHSDDLARVLDELRAIAFGGMADFVRITPDGDPMIDMSAATPAMLNTLESVELEDFVDGRGDNARSVRKVKIKRLDKLGALKLLGQHYGLGNKREEEATDRLTQALMDICKRGSSQPIGKGR